MDYAEKLKDPRWQKKRLEILNRDEWTCLDCGATNKTLHVHHDVYFDGTEPWDCPGESLSTLCEDCHKARKQVPRQAQQRLGAMIALLVQNDRDLFKYIGQTFSNLAALRLLEDESPEPEGGWHPITFIDADAVLRAICAMIQSPVFVELALRVEEWNDDDPVIASLRDKASDLFMEEIRSVAHG